MPMNPRLLVPRATFDPDAAAYLRAVEAADGQALETPVKRAVDDFFRGIKADGTFSAIKAACLLCGARTLAGALVPLVGTAPTNVADGFVEGDYTRGGATPGLKGDGTSYLDSGRANNSDPQNDKHLACYQSAAGSPPEALIGSIIRTPALSVSQVFLATIPSVVGAAINSPAVKQENGSVGIGLVGAVRNAGTQTLYFAGNSYDEERESNGHHSLNTFVFARNDEGAVSFPSDATLAFYSIGEALDLALLDTRVTALITAIGAAV